MKTGLLRRAAVLTIGIGTSLSVAAQQPPSSAVRLSSPETIHVRLTLDDAIYAAQNQSIAAMVAKYTFLSAYWSFRSFQASRLPSLNLTGEVLSFDRSLRLLQDYDTGEMRYLENYNLQNRCGLPHYLFRRSPHRGATSRTMVEGGRMNRRADHSLIVNSSARSFGT